MSLLYNLSPTTRKELAELKPTLGYCVLIDLVESTSLKDEKLDIWMHRIFNTFSLTRNSLAGIRPLKAVGDELMFYLREADLEARSETALNLFLSLCLLVQEEDEEIFRPTKAAITYCQDAYDITFIKDTQDFYGKDIDLAARLLLKADKGEILMNEPFIERMQTAHQASTGARDLFEKSGIKGPWPERIKGFSGFINVYKLPAGAVSLINAMLRSHQPLEKPKGN